LDPGDRVAAVEGAGRRLRLARLADTVAAVVDEDRPAAQTLIGRILDAVAVVILELGAAQRRVLPVTEVLGGEGRAGAEGRAVGAGARVDNTVGVGVGGAGVGLRAGPTRLGYLAYRVVPRLDPGD